MVPAVVVHAAAGVTVNSSVKLMSPVPVRVWSARPSISTWDRSDAVATVRV
jgi:hypothetical protein